ncbi:uncharacterized protein LOC108105885 isoform X2 [Drosophila eugracilis]|uniref:uncharacterized protein LOC108105885 isoform X2 n=1 Tax=Drosophila eugracilis TaxID=29029 RepID=UPI001BDAD011|nr:uncharacterized protein LOC108105885 isoform X2 [Drosophila eugracilis]
MLYSNLLIVCSSLVLLHLEMTASTSTGDQPSQALIDTAKMFGLDEVGLRELWRTKDPLVVRNQNSAGQLTTVTYSLSPDGKSISRSRVIEGSSPARLEEGATIAKPQEDWEYVPNPSRRQFRPIGEPNVGEGSFDPSLFGFPAPRGSLFPNWRLPDGVTPRVTTKTEVDNLGRRITTTTKSFSGVVLPGSNVLQQTFPDIAKEPGPINPIFGQIPSIGNYPTFYSAPSDFNSGFVPRSSQQDPTFVPVIDATTTQRTVVPLPTQAPRNVGGGENDIDDFLAKVDLTAEDIEKSNGEVVKTIVDKNGRVLTARFVLSSVKGDKNDLKQQSPTK